MKGIRSYWGYQVILRVSGHTEGIRSYWGHHVTLRASCHTEGIMSYWGHQVILRVSCHTVSFTINQRFFCWNVIHPIYEQVCLDCLLPWVFPIVVMHGFFISSLALLVLCFLSSFIWLPTWIIAYEFYILCSSLDLFSYIRSNWDKNFNQSLAKMLLNPFKFMISYFYWHKINVKRTAWNISSLYLLIKGRIWT